KGEPPLLLRLRDRDRDTGDPRPPADPAVAGGDARHMRAVRPLDHLRLRLQHVRRERDRALTCRLDRAIHLLATKLRPITERARPPLARRRMRVTALIPDPFEPGPSLVVQAAGVG